MPSIGYNLQIVFNPASVSAPLSIKYTSHSDWRGELIVRYNIIPVQIGLVATAAVSERLSDLMQVPEKKFGLLNLKHTLNLQSEFTEHSPSPNC